MMKVKHIRKVLALALAMAASPLLEAQSDGFFDYSDGSLRDSDGYGVTAENQTFNGSTPLGGGIAILVASAAGYTLLKRRKQQDSKTTKNLAK